MSDEEMSWLKEKGDLPIRPNMSLMNSTKAFDQISFSSQATDGCVKYLITTLLLRF